MKYLHITLNNFKSFQGKHTFKLDREPGLYFVAGKNKLTGDSNGAGKTSLWDALYWVRWGKTGRDKRPANAVVPWRGEKKNVFVNLMFEGIDNKVRELYRSRKPNKLKLGYIDEELKDVSQEELDKLFGDSEEIFRRAEVLSQFDTFFLDMRPEQQSQMFTDALNLDIYLNAAELANKKVRAAKHELEDINIERSKLLGQIKEIKNSLYNEQEAAEQFKNRQHAKVKETQTLLATKIQDIEEMVNGPIGPARPGGGKAPKATPTERASGGGSAGKRGAASTLVYPPPWRGAVGPLQTRLQSGLTQIERQLNKVKGLLVDATAKHQNTKNSLEKEIENIENYEESIKGNKRCPECNQLASVDHLKTKLMAANKNLKNIYQLIKISASEIKELEQNKIDKETRWRKQAKLLVNFTQAVKEAKQLETNIKVLKEENNPHLETIDNYKLRLKKLRTTKHLCNGQILSLEKEIETNKYWTEAFKNIRLELIDDTLTELEMAVIQHASELGMEDWEIKFNTERESKAGNVTMAFSAVLYPPNTNKAAKWQSYSGGESQRWQLAVALGLSDVILTRMGVQPNIEVYDEPTKGMSSKGTEILLQHLRERALELGKAIYLVEHHSLERGSFDGVITIVKTKKGSSIYE